MSTKQRIVGNILLLLASLAFSFVCLELAARFILPYSTTFYVRQPNLETTFYPMPDVLAGVHDPSVFRTDAIGLRGDDLSSHDDLRILAVGGSTTECLYLDQSEAWPQLLQDHLTHLWSGSTVWVGNAGKSGISTAEHVLQVRHLLPELPRVDLIVVLVGVNDLSNRLARDTEYAPDIGPVPSTLERLVRAFDVLPRFDDPTLSFIKRTRLWFFLTKVRYLFAGRNTVQDRAGEVYIEHRRLRHDAPEFRSALPDLTPALEEYRHRLELILAEARTHNTPILFVTQPTLWRADLTAEESSRLWFGWAGDRWGKEPVPYYTPAALAKGLSLYNETLMTFCRSQHVPCLDLAARMPSDARWFYDDVHFSEEGSSRVADILANEVARLTHPSDLPSTFPVP